MFVRSVEDGLKKAIELLIVAILLGSAIKLVMIVVPAVTLGSITAKLTKIFILEK